MDKQTLLSGVRMTPVERAQGRYLRAPDGHEGDESGTGTGESGSGQTNQGGNTDLPNQNGTGQNNSGATLDPASFWSEPAPSAASSNGESAAGEGSGQQSEQVGQRFAQQLQGLQFGELFTKEAMAAMTDNQDPSVFHSNLQTFGREAVRQSVLMNARLMQVYGDQLREEIRQEFRQEFGNRDADSDLVKAIPSYANPAIQPTVKRIFDQAMKVTQGKRAEAIQMTKEMLALQTGALQDDLGLRAPPPSPNDQMASPTDWEKELLGR